MSKDKQILVILYNNLSTKRVELDSKDDIINYVYNEGDHVLDWYVEKDNNDKT